MYLTSCDMVSILLYNVIRYNNCIHHGYNTIICSAPCQASRFVGYGHGHEVFVADLNGAVQVCIPDLKSIRQ